VLGGNRIPNSRQHVGNRISHSLTPFSISNCQLPIEYQLEIGNRKSAMLSTNSISPRRESVPATPTRESKSGTDETCADKRAGGRTFYNGCMPGTKISACDSLSRLMISLPYQLILDFRFQI
jgi:hypothetical protein